jgi:hypothetical protein
MRLRASAATRCRLALCGTLVTSAIVAASAGAAPGGTAGPSSSKDPYVVRSQPGVVFKSVLTTGDSVPKVGGGSYRMAGIPDGLGAFDNGDGTFTVLMNHELTNVKGVARAHGGIGAFVSEWVIRKDDLTVVSGEDLIEHVHLWSGAGYVTAPDVIFSRFCSADLPARSALYNAATGKGFDGRLFLNGEENGSEGRGFAHALDGNSYELPWLGKFSFENSLANWGTGDRTVVISQDDAGGGKGQPGLRLRRRQEGNRRDAGGSGGPHERKSVRHQGDRLSRRGRGDGDSERHPLRRVLVRRRLVEVRSAARDRQQHERCHTVPPSRRRRMDTSNPNVYYFVTTDQYPGKSRLWRLTFDDASHPELGGTIDMLLDGTEGQQMLDNITVDDRGQIVALEDIGDQPALGKVWHYDIAGDAITQVAEHDPALFTPGAPDFITQDEETSGVIDVSTILGEGWYLLDDQVHAASADPELVEGGQLLAMHVPPGRFTK